MIVVFYRSKTGPGIKQIPFTNKANAIEKAKYLHKKGYTSVKVSEIEEKIIYIPVLGKEL